MDVMGPKGRQPFDTPLWHLHQVLSFLDSQSYENEVAMLPGPPETLQQRRWQCYLQGAMLWTTPSQARAAIEGIDVVLEAGEDAIHYWVYGWFLAEHSILASSGRTGRDVLLEVRTRLQEVADREPAAHPLFGSPPSHPSVN